MAPARVALLLAAFACSSPKAADPDPITLYGLVYVTAESVEAKPSEVHVGSGVPRTARISDQSSRVGVRGLEHFGADWRAFFQLETGFRPDQNNTTFAARNSAVGLQGRWGSVLLGRWDTPLKSATTAVDVFEDLTLGGVTAALNGSGVGPDRGTFDRRDANAVQYWSPEAPIAVRLAYSVPREDLASPQPRNLGASLIYRAGPSMLGFAYDEMRDQDFNGVSGIDRQRAQAFFVKWDVGHWRLGGIYEEIRRDGFSTQAAWLANVIYTLGRSRFAYQYQHAKNGRDLRSRDLGAKVLFLPGMEPSCEVHAFAWFYHLSPRTFALAQYVRVHNNPVATCNFGSNALNLQKFGGEQPRGYALGLRHGF